MKNILNAFALLSVAASSTLSAATIVYDLRDAAQTTAIESGSYLVDGVKLSMSSDQGALNQTSSFFGINHGGAGDDTDQIDGVAGAETLSFSFETNGTLDLLVMSDYGTLDTFELRKNGTLVLNLVNQGQVDEFSPAESFIPTDEFTLTYTGGNGASLDSMTITTLPEPSGSLLLSIGGAILLLRRNKQ